MYCKSCGIKIDDDSKFCSTCGTKQSIVIKPINCIDLSIKEYPTSGKNNFIVNKKNTEYYSKDSDATALGVLLIIIFGFIYYLSYDKTFHIEDVIFYFVVSLIFKIISIIKVVNVAKRQNRNQTFWGIFAFIVPALALIIIGQTKKLFDYYEQKGNDESKGTNPYEDFLNVRGK